jgi:O-antigen ligase
MFAIFLLGSRAGVLALIINFLIILIYFGKKYTNFKLIIAGSVLIGSVFVSSYYFIPQVKHRINMAIYDIEKVYKSNNYNTSLGIRVALYETSFKLLLDNPKSFIFGLGYGDAKLKFKNYLDKNEPNKAFIAIQPHVHNQYLQTWIDGGLFAMLLYLWMLITLLKLKIPHYYKLGLYGFVSSFAVLGFSDIIYHRGVILGLFAFGIGLFLSIVQHYSKNQFEERYNR